MFCSWLLILILLWWLEYSLLVYSIDSLNDGYKVVFDWIDSPFLLSNNVSGGKSILVFQIIIIEIVFMIINSNIVMMMIIFPTCAFIRFISRQK